MESARPEPSRAEPRNAWRWSSADDTPFCCQDISNAGA